MDVQLIYGVFLGEAIFKIMLSGAAEVGSDPAYMISYCHESCSVLLMSSLIKIIISLSDVNPSDLIFFSDIYATVINRTYDLTCTL